jgi:hypothetical protein
MKKLAENLTQGAIFVLGVIVTAIVTSLITGEPLSGLSRFQGLYRIFISGTVPAWGFAGVLVVMLSLAAYVARGIWKAPRHGRVHFVLEDFCTYWAKRPGSAIYLSVSGIFTYEGPAGGTNILGARLHGTTQSIFGVRELPDPHPVPTTSEKFPLPDGVPKHAIIYAYLQIPKSGFEMKGECEVILTDMFNREFVIGPMSLPEREPERGADAGGSQTSA